MVICPIARYRCLVRPERVRQAMARDVDKVLVLFSPLIQEYNHSMAAKSECLSVTRYDELAKKALDDRLGGLL